MTGCAAFGCTNRSEKGFLMKVFPKDPARRKLWEIKVKRENWKATDSSYLCEVHFPDDQWEKTRVDGTRKLKHNAVPSIFSYAPLKKSRRVPPVRNPLSSKTCKISKDDASSVEQASSYEPATDNFQQDNFTIFNEDFSFEKCKDKDKIIDELKSVILKKDKIISKLHFKLINVDKRLIRNRIQKFRACQNDKVKTALQDIFKDDQLACIS
ncbi:THAP domain-containing protein 1-like [Centruroides sculpturatus]|uniref:THAP domain-containing protein 1-like n=1 Tax=Centruroides sculpturatus TaxID=218467 RepID=UPI000C6CA4A7|nr:THAP domain-containing protein 1-like [Centruroides sculpturatus]XP_023209448.1 THAP domain-containing protein 1-like [Centruroides sculpturatus]XP_023209451.1 THAP domain-containing protein 1-like [Centruroides sculpturatus]XP_023209452.1 THAP domain-containing protein 1-like [Centruroides sculpturatus]